MVMKKLIAEAAASVRAARAAGRACRAGAGLLLVLATAPAWADCRGMVLHAHRGAPTAPENSAAAVRQALDGDWDAVEIDLQALRDGAWVLHHDAQLGRTTSLRGRAVRDLDSAVWREVRLKDRQGRQGSEPAAWLSDIAPAVQAAQAKVLNAEIKQIGASCEAVQQLGSGLQAQIPSGRWFLTSIDRRQLECVRRADPHGYLGQIVLDPQALARQGGAAAAGRLAPPVLDLAWLRRLQQEVGAPVGVHVDINTLAANPRLLGDARTLGMPVFTYHLGPDRQHAEALRAQARRSGLLPTGAIIDGLPAAFCELLGKP